MQEPPHSATMPSTPLKTAACMTLVPTAMSSVVSFPPLSIYVTRGMVLIVLAPAEGGAALRNPRAGVEHFSSGVFARPFGVYRGISSELGRDEMRDGLRVYDADTHVEPTAEVIDSYVDPGFRPRLADLAPYRQPVRPGSPGGAPGRHVYRYGQISYKRILGEAAPRETHSGRDTQWMGSKQPRPGTQDDQAASRLQDMDDEGTDTHFLIPTSWTSFVGHEDPAIEVNIIRAFHRHMADFSGNHPDRLQSMIVASARDV